MQQNQANGTSSTSISSNIINRRRPHVWQDDMAEVKETFRRVARARHSRGYSAGETSPTRVTAPMLSRNRRARIRCQVPVKALHMSPGCLQVPIKVLQEIQGNRSQSPFVSLNHLQNVLGMCRRIRSQQSLTERKKNPHDPAVYPVYVRRPWSVSACMCHKSPVHPNHLRDVSPNPPYPVTPNIHISPNPSCPHFKGYTHINPNIHNPHVISSQPDVMLGHVKVNARNQCRIEDITDISPSTKPHSAHLSPNCHITHNCHISPNCHVSSNAGNHLPLNPHPHRSPNDPSTPLYYKPARFKPLYDISNGVFPHNYMRKRAPVASSNEKIRTSAQEKPLWTHYKKLILHPSVDDPQHANPPHAAGVADAINMQQNSDFNGFSAASLHAAPFAWSSPESLIITKKPRTRSSPMFLSESWPSSSSFSNDPHHHHHFADDFQAHFDCNELADFLNSDRRPHSENDLNLHSANYFLERPPSRCMKRPLSSCSSSWRNVSAYLLGNCMDKNLEGGYADAWSPNTSSSQQDVSIFIPRDLDGNILSHLPCSYKSDTSSSIKQKYPKNSKDNAEHKRRYFGGPLSDMSKKHKAAGAGECSVQRSKHVYISTSKACAKRNTTTTSAGCVTKKKPTLASTSSCLDDLEGLPPSKWAKKLASDLMGPYRAKANSTSNQYCKEAHAPHVNCSFGNGFKHRVKFASPSVQINSDGFRKEAQSLAAAEMIPDLLSWERDSGLLTGDPPAIAVHADNEEELDQKLLEQVEAMLDASSSSLSSPSACPSPSPESLTMSPMLVCSPARHDHSDSCSKFLSDMELSIECGDVFGQEAINYGGHLKEQEDYIGEQHLQQEKNKQNAEQTENARLNAAQNMSCVDEFPSKEQVKPAQAAKRVGSSVIEPHVNGSLINIHHNIALIEVMESKCNAEETGAPQAGEEDQDMKSADSSPKLRRGIAKSRELGRDEEGLIQEEDVKGNVTTMVLQTEDVEENTVRMVLEKKEDIDEEYVCVEHEIDVKGDQCALDAEYWELEKLFQDSLDLNPTFRHLYDTMSHLNAPCAVPIFKQIPSS